MVRMDGDNSHIWLADYVIKNKVIVSDAQPRSPKAVQI